MFRRGEGENNHYGCSPLTPSKHTRNLGVLATNHLDRILDVPVET